VTSLKKIIGKDFFVSIIGTFEIVNYKNPLKDATYWTSGVTSP